MNNNDFAERQLAQIRHRIADAADKAGRDASSIRLIGASKQQNAQLMAEFHTVGLQNVGENYLQEALEKQSALADQPLTWHYIGRIQSNKCKRIAEHFTWVHSVDRLSIAQRFAKQNESLSTLNLLLQINIDDEASKAGVAASEVPELCAQMSELTNIRLRGFMVLPKTANTVAEQRHPFAAARELLEQCNQRYGIKMDQLSMGMSGDLEAAVLEGSTMLRIGTDLFGPRQR